VSDVMSKRYYGYLFELEQRFDRAQVAASYVYSKSQGSIDSADGQYAGIDFDFFDPAGELPDNFRNRDGYLSDDARHRVKLFAHYRIPWIETGLAINYFYRTGLPYTVTGRDVFGSAAGFFVEPRGSRRTPVLHTLDASLDKEFNLFDDLSMTVIGQVRNVLGDERPLTYFSSVNSPATLHTPATYTLPRSYQIGFRLDF
jgi:hypothetical protein